jgi:hypothetical protein
MPGVGPATFIADYGHAAAYLANVLATYPHVPQEPALACYVTATCPKRRSPTRFAARAGRRTGQHAHR